jgi:type VI secretion system protein ImpH
VPPQSVEQRLYDEPFAFDFFQAARLLSRLAPDRVLVGRGGPPMREVVRFRALPSLSFPPSAIHDLTRATSEQPVPALVVTFMGLTGPSGVLPRHYTELILRLERERRGEERRAFRDWLDLFNHRFISLFLRAWEKYRFWIAYERNEHDRPEQDTFTHALRCFVGLGTGGLRERLRVVAVEAGRERERRLAGIDDRSLLHYAGLLSSRRRTAAGLEALLTDYFGLSVKVKQFVGQWLDLEPTSQTTLGVVDGNGQLGVNVIAGERVWDVQGKIRLRLGPLSFARFNDFLPDRTPLPEHKGFFLLKHLARLYVGPDLDFDIQPVLRADDVPECQLSDEPPGPRLGWNTWLVSQQPGNDADDALFAAEEVVRIEEEHFAPY